MVKFIFISIQLFSLFLSIQSAEYCLAGEYLTSSNQCALCPSGCLFCEDITGACTYCSGLIPAWTNTGSKTSGCTCPTSQYLAFNTSSSQFKCMTGTQANSYYNETIISQITNNLTDANIIYLKGAAFGVNGNNATTKLLKITNILYNAQDVLNISSINLIELAWTLIGKLFDLNNIQKGITYNSNANTYDILYKLVYFANKIQAASAITMEFTQYFTEFHGLLIAKLGSGVNFTNVTAQQQQILRQQIQTTFDNFKSIFLAYHDFTEYTEHVYHYTNLYIRIMKVTDNVYSSLILDTYKFEGTNRLLKNFPQNQSIYFAHIIEQINPFANVSSSSIQPPYSYIQDIQFFIGQNYTTAMSYLGNVTYQAGFYYPQASNAKNQLLYWNSNTYSWKYSLANCGQSTQGNISWIYCFPDSLVKSLLYGLESNSSSI